ncbi:hypothetical protein CFP56_030895 [Quercus suber]|uniref:DUF2921 domain-containing protein n=1 Tax=Quercus suber TaxID=58331 RepID=A0AAW0JN74_QUESU
MGFPNPSTGMKFEFPGPNATLIAEGAWDEKDNQFCGVACRILADASVGDCSIGFSLRFPAVLSLRNMGKKDVNDSECFGRIGFQSWERPSDPQGLRYEYTEIEEVRNTEGKVASGFYRPQFLGDVLCVQQDELKSNHSRMLNMSYKTGFTPPPDFRFGADALYKLEYIYDRDTGLLCMIGCWHLDFQLNDQNSIKNGSLNCETRIKVQFPPLHAEQAEIAKGAIESRRSTSDPLYSESFQLSSNSITTTQAKEPIWKLKFVYELEYLSDCGSVNCNPLGGSIGHLPNWIAFRGLQCD